VEQVSPWSTSLQRKDSSHSVLVVTIIIIASCPVASGGRTTSAVES
jgi:hypothetical protein